MNRSGELVGTKTVKASTSSVSSFGSFSEMVKYPPRSVKLVTLPVSWAAVPIAAMALAFERLHLSRTQLVDTVVGPLSRMTMVVAALAGAALAIPIAASAPFERAALPVEIVLLTGYYVLRASRGAAWEQRLATAGPGLAVVATVYSAGADLAVVALASVVVGSAYVAHELASSIDRGLGTLAPWMEPRLTTLGLAFLGAEAEPARDDVNTPRESVVLHRPQPARESQQ